jgi:hypothetical protein
MWKLEFLGKNWSNMNEELIYQKAVAQAEHR